MLNTWMKWDIIGEQTAHPVYIFVVGETGEDPAPMLCTTARGYSFFVSQRFVDRLLSCTEEEQARLAGLISKAVILDNNGHPKTFDGKTATPAAAISFSDAWRQD
jgi:hypothetical protein